MASAIFHVSYFTPSPLYPGPYLAGESFGDIIWLGVAGELFLTTEKPVLFFSGFFGRGPEIQGPPLDRDWNTKKTLRKANQGIWGGSWIFIKIGLDVRDFEFQFIVDLAF